jgi:hypothetical protein
MINLNPKKAPIAIKPTATNNHNQLKEELVVFSTGSGEEIGVGMGGGGVFLRGGCFSVLCFKIIGMPLKEDSADNI